VDCYGLAGEYCGGGAAAAEEEKDGKEKERGGGRHGGMFEVAIFAGQRGAPFYLYVCVIFSLESEESYYRLAQPHSFTSSGALDAVGMFSQRIETQVSTFESPDEGSGGFKLLNRGSCGGVSPLGQHL
jgi:hypothetical protein